MEIIKTTPRFKVRIISGLTTLLLLVAVVSCLSIVLQSISQGYVQFFGHSLFRVVTGSMEPTIPVGTILVVKEAPIETIEKDNIVCFRSNNPGSNGMIVTHRVMGVYDTPDGVRCLRTKGDNNLSVDATPVTQSNLIGRIIWYSGDGSIMAGIIQFITSEFGFLACIILPVLLIAVWVFRDAAKSIRKEMKQLEDQLDQHGNSDTVDVMTTEEYQQMVQRLSNEIRKEMELDAQANHTDDTSLDEQPEGAMGIAPSADNEDAVDTING